jgi:two-component system chemotaxis response regulator CheY
MFPSNTRILVVDDLKTIRLLLIEMLQNLGYKNLHEAADGVEALKKLKAASNKEQAFGLMITDWNMPGMTGIELLQEKNSDPELKSIPTLMVTIESEREQVLKAVALGVSDFVVKPFSEKTIEAKLNGIWERLTEKGPT